MGLGPTLIGAVLGAAVGIGLHLGFEMTIGEATWFPIIIGALTGFGVRQANRSLVGRVSYLRGAITAAIALAAIVGSTPLISMALQKKGAKAAEAVPIAKSDVAQDGAADGESAADLADGKEQADPRSSVGAPVGQIGNLRAKDDFNVWQFAFMAIGMFIAYELGRGSAGAHAPPVEEARAEPSRTEPAPGGVDPSA